MKRLLLALSILAATVTPVAAKDVILPGGCGQGQCVESKFISKDALKSDSSGGVLYAVKTATRNYQMGEKPTSKFGVPKTTFVYCSTKLPAIVFDGYGTYTAHLLNPGNMNSVWGYNRSGYNLYWLTCHNFVGGIDPSGTEMTARAIKLGYPLNLPTEQIELNSPLEITLP